MKGKIFNAQEVQAIIEGNKTMFREVVKEQPPHDFKTREKTIQLHNNIFCNTGENYDFYFGVAPYQVGQKIFVKESFDYREHYSIGNYDHYTAWKKRPAQHMKQEHSRLFLRITKIKVERLQDINEEDARLEGFPVDHLGNYYEPSKLDPWQGYARASFSLSWDPTHKNPEEKFYANPFVWVVDFKINK